MKPAPILSICIPTFQRKESLKRTLQKLIESEKLVPGKIEICISDNASNDGTFEMLEGYKKKYPFIRIRKNLRNLGFDSNLVASFKMAHGEYCWGIGDDDTAMPEGVRALVLQLKKKKRFIMGLAGAMAHKRDIDLNAQHFQKQEYTNKEFIRSLISTIKDSSKMTKAHQDITILGFLPCYFFSNNVLKKSFKSLEGKRYGWYHLALLFYVLSNFEGTIIVNKKISLKHGQLVEHQKDSTSLPGDEFDILVTRRIKTLSNIVVNTKLRKSFYNWLNVRGNYLYVKNLVELLLISEMVSKLEYTIIKKKVYTCKNKLKMPFLIWLTTTLLRSMEPLIFFRKLIAILYSKIHYVYIKQIEDHLKGHLQSYDERDGNFSSRNKYKLNFNLR